MIHDSRRYHRVRPPTFTRAYGQQQSTPSIQSPFGAVPQRMAGRLGRQQINPLLIGLGLGTGKAAKRLQRQIESGQAKGPLASAIQQIQQFAPGVIQGAQDVGKRVSAEGETAIQSLRDSITQAQQSMPQYQQGTQQAFEATQGALGNARDLYGQAAAMLPGLQDISKQGTQGAQAALGAAQNFLTGPAVSGAQDALSLAQQNARGPQMQAANAQLQRAQSLLSGGTAQTGAEQAAQLAQKYAQQASSPIANEDLYRMASQRALSSLRPGLAARGLEAGGSGAQAESDTLSNLAYNFAQNQAAQRQATLQGLTGATTNLGNLQSQAQQNVGAAASGLGNLQAQGTQGITGAATGLGNLQQAGISGLGNAAQNVQGAAANQAALGQTMLPYLQAIQQGAQGVGQMAGQGANINMMSPQLAGMQANAVNQLGQTLMQQYNMPMQGAGNLLNLLTAGQAPGLQLLGATSPSVANSSKGFNVL